MKPTLKRKHEHKRIKPVSSEISDLLLLARYIANSE